jgi:hypothetical protein
MTSKSGLVTGPLRQAKKRNRLPLQAKREKSCLSMYI